MNHEERYSRQASIVPADKLATITATIVGVGAIGRNVALQLASIGVSRLHIIDFDVVEESNIASQGYLEADMGMPKVEATARSCKAINSNIEVTTVNGKFKRSMVTGEALFSCVDSMEIRKLIWDSKFDKFDFYADGRMTAEVLRIITAASKEPETIEYYPTTLFSDEEAQTGSCTAKTTVYCANVAAGFLVSSFTKWLRGAPTDKDVSLSLFANEMSYGT